MAEVELRGGLKSTRDPCEYRDPPAACPCFLAALVVREGPKERKLRDSLDSFLRNCCPLSSYHSTAFTSASLCDGAAAARRPRHACDYSPNGPRNETLGAATPTCACRKVYMRIASCSRSITTPIASVHPPSSGGACHKRMAEGKAHSWADRVQRVDSSSFSPICPTRDLLGRRQSTAPVVVVL